MFATRNDQENLVHNQQTAAAAKPLNQGLKGYAAKTPAPKTPFRVPLNDENAAAGKSVLKTNVKAKGNGGFGGKKGSEVDKSAFVTPAGPRNRAPLGMKTTNAKAKAFRTPAPLIVDNKAEKTLQKTLSPRLRRPKVKVHQPEPVAQAEQEEEPDIEHVPPKEQPLPDYPSDVESESHFGPDKTYPQLEGENFTRGAFGVFFNPVDDNGESYVDKQNRLFEEEAKAQLDDECARIGEPEWKETQASLRAELGLSPIKKTAKESPTSSSTSGLLHAATNRPRNPGTLASRSAATALAAPTKSSLARQEPQKQRPSAVAPRAGLMNRRVREQPANAPKPAPPASSALGVGAAASKFTLGYKQGRAASSTLRNPAPSKPARALSPTAAGEPKESAAGVGNAKSSPRPTKVAEPPSSLSNLTGLGLNDKELDDDLGMGETSSLFGNEDDEEIFQFRFES